METKTGNQNGTSPKQEPDLILVINSLLQATSEAENLTYDIDCKIQQIKKTEDEKICDTSPIDTEPEDAIKKLFIIAHRIRVNNAYLDRCIANFNEII